MSAFLCVFRPLISLWHLQAGLEVVVRAGGGVTPVQRPPDGGEEKVDSVHQHAVVVRNCSAMLSTYVVSCQFETQLTNTAERQYNALSSAVPLLTDD